MSTSVAPPIGRTGQAHRRAFPAVQWAGVGTGGLPAGIRLHPAADKAEPED